MAHTYSHLFGLPTTGLRFFTVYGPWVRPDMSMALFTKAILAGEPIEVFNHGKMQRDFTYIDDIVEGVVRVPRREPANRDRRHAGSVFRPSRAPAVSNLQHRQQPAGPTPRVHPPYRAGDRAEGQPRSATDATRRCARNGSEHERPRGGGWVPAPDAARRRHPALRRLASAYYGAPNRGGTPQS